jgi:hypothetical protein
MSHVPSCFVSDLELLGFVRLRVRVLHGRAVVPRRCELVHRMPLCPLQPPPPLACPGRPCGGQERAGKREFDRLVKQRQDVVHKSPLNYQVFLSIYLANRRIAPGE